MAKVKVPKTVAGVKIPKKVRKSASKAIKMAESPAVREIAAVAIGRWRGEKRKWQRSDPRRNPGQCRARRGSLPHGRGRRPAQLHGGPGGGAEGSGRATEIRPQAQAYRSSVRRRS
jgi:hypothetical protein